MNDEVYAALVAAFDLARDENPDTAIEAVLRIGTEEHTIVNTTAPVKAKKKTKETR